MYKLVAKCITNRMKRVLFQVIISESQSGFVTGRLITNNAFIAFETIHLMKRCLKVKCFKAAVKLDMFKAYDRIEWNFLDARMP